ALLGRHAGLLGGGGSRCNESCISGCPAGRSTGGTCLGGKLPARQLRRTHSPRSSTPPDGGFSPRSIRPQPPPASLQGCHWRTPSPFSPASPPPRQSSRQTPRHSERWQHRAAPTTRP